MEVLHSYLGDEMLGSWHLEEIDCSVLCFESKLDATYCWMVSGIGVLQYFSTYLSLARYLKTHQKWMAKFE